MTKTNTGEANHMKMTPIRDTPNDDTVQSQNIVKRQMMFSKQMRPTTLWQNSHQWWQSHENDTY